MYSEVYQGILCIEVYWGRVGFIGVYQGILCIEVYWCIVGFIGVYCVLRLLGYIVNVVI